MGDPALVSERKNPGTAAADEVIGANISFYREVARKYDSYESCRFDPFLQQMLDSDVERIGSILSSAGTRPIKCLDCGGGTGNIAIRLLQRGWDVTVVDVSREMLDVLEHASRALGLAPAIHKISLEEFLSSDRSDYDVISFGSVLHHLHSYLDVLGMALQRMRPGGILYTNFDPVPPRYPRMSQLFDSIDTFVAKLAYDPGDVLPGIRRRAVKMLSKPRASHNRVVLSAGDLAEYHVRSGVDDERVLRLLKDRGFAVLEHSRYPVGRTGVLRRINRGIGVLQHFKILARLPQDHGTRDITYTRRGCSGAVKPIRPHKILSIHNYYQERGGEDVVADSERELLRAFGYTVVDYSRQSEEIKHYGPCAKAALVLRTTWAWDTYREIKRVLRVEQPRIAHFHNTLPLVSPAAYYACREAGIPVVQTLHNYRLLCPAATFFRRGGLCEECVQHSLWRSVRYGCYRQSRTTTAALSLMLALHRWRETWLQQVNVYVALTQFARQKFVAAGIPPDKIVVKSNFVHPDPGCTDAEGAYAVYVGRLCEEKGLTTLLRAWHRLPTAIPLRIVGEGPIRQELERKVEAWGLDDVRFMGWQPRDNVLAIIKKARFLLFASEWYETFGRTAIEAFACGVPVVASRLGAMEEIVEDQRSGLYFTPADPEDLAEKVEWAWSHPERMRDMGREARREFEAKYTRERNHELLLQIYERAISA